MVLSPDDSGVRLIVGLGNPSEEYSRTRHNAGFMIVDAFSGSLPRSLVKESRICDGILRTAKFAGREIHMIKPLTYMNLSGDAVGLFIEKKKIMPSQMLVVYDDLDILLGRIRICRGGGSAGHNGIESIIKRTRSADFARFRAGIGVEIAERRKDFVLSEFTQKENEIFARSVEMSVSAIKFLLSRGIDAAMNEFNGMDYDKFSQKNNKS